VASLILPTTIAITIKDLSLLPVRHARVDSDHPHIRIFRPADDYPQTRRQLVVHGTMYRHTYVPDLLSLPSFHDVGWSTSIASYSPMADEDPLVGLQARLRKLEYDVTGMGTRQKFPSTSGRRTLQ